MSYLPATCISGSQWLISNQELGAGHEGISYVACCQQECDYVAKQILTYLLPKTELEIQREAAKAGIGPEIYDVFNEGNYTYIIMAKLDKTFGQALSEIQTQFEEAYELILEAVNKINELHELGISHNDITFNNMMVDKTGNVFLIDYGTASYSDEGFYNDFLGLFYELPIWYPKLALYVKSKLIADDIFSAEIVNDLIEINENVNS